MFPLLVFFLFILVLVFSYLLLKPNPPPLFFICLSPAHFLPVTIRVFCNKVCQKIHCFCIKKLSTSCCQEVVSVQFHDGRGHPPSLSQRTSAGSFFPSILHILPTFVSLVPQLSFSTVCLYSKYSFSFQIIVSPLKIPWKQIINKQSFPFPLSTCSVFKKYQLLPRILTSSIPWWKRTSSQSVSENLFRVFSPSVLHYHILPTFVSLVHLYFLFHSLILFNYSFSPNTPLKANHQQTVLSFSLSTFSVFKKYQLLPRSLTSSIPWWNGISSQSFSGNLWKICSSSVLPSSYM